MHFVYYTFPTYIIHIVRICHGNLSKYVFVEKEQIDISDNSLSKQVERYKSFNAIYIKFTSFKWVVEVQR